MSNPLHRLLGQAARLVRRAGWEQAADALEAAGGAAPPVATGQPAQFLVGRHEDESGARDYKLYLPAGDRSRPIPLVVMLHGCQQDPDDFAIGTGMNAAAEARGCAVLYPAQTRTANLNRCWNWFKPQHQQRDRGECGLLAGMIRAVIARHGLDARRVYVAGLSAGGAMAALLAEAYPELVAAVGVHAGVPAGAAQGLASAMAVMKTGRAPDARLRAAGCPMIVFHGDLDTTVHPANGERLVAPLAAALPSERSAGLSPFGRTYTRTVFRDAQGRAQGEHWLVHGLGHAWSGGHLPGSYTDPTGPDATQAMLDFFLTHTLSTRPQPEPQGVPG